MRRVFRWMVFCFWLVVIGCASKPLKGGRAVTSPRPAGGVEQTIVQGENPAQVTKQDQETVRVRSYTLPAGSRIEEARVERSVAAGAAQKDTAREVGAKLASLRGVVWVGLGLFLFGLATLFYPPLKLIIGSVTTSAAMVLGGVALMVLPTLIVGNELLILGAVGLAVGGWFLAHRHGQLRGTVESSKSDAAGSCEIGG